MSEAGEAWPGHWAPFGVTADEEGVERRPVGRGRRPRSRSASSTRTAPRPGYPLDEHDLPRLARLLPGAAPGPAVRLPRPRAVGPAARARFNPAKLLVDPYARAVERRARRSATPCFGHVRARRRRRRDDRDSAPYVPRSVVVGDDFDWGGRPAAERTPWADTVIYELHVKGFTTRHPAVPRAAARHVRRAGAPGGDRAPDRPRRDRGRAAAGAPLRQRGPPRDAAA